MYAETDKIRQIFADALNLDLSEVNTNSNLVDDLGAESIDFLDITFQLESEYSIRIPKGEIIALAQAGLSDDEFAQGGVVTAEGLKNLQNPTLALDEKKLAQGMKMQTIPEAFTVQTFINLVKRQLEKVAAPTNLVTAEA